MKHIRGKREQQHHRHGIYLRACGLFAFLAVFAGIIAGVSAKYIHKTEIEGQAVALNFYFSSDLLDGQTHTISALEADGTASVTFLLQNHADELRYAEVDIDYTVSVDNNGRVSPASGTIAKGESHDVSITVSGLQPGQTYTVTAQATAPYTATLTGIITVAAKDSAVHFTTADKEQYVEVTVWTADYAGNVILTYPAGLIPDNTDTIMANWKTGEQEQTVSMEANSAHVFRLFKSADYTGSGSEVTVNAQ